MIEYALNRNRKVKLVNQQEGQAPENDRIYLVRSLLCESNNTVIVVLKNLTY